MGLLNPVHNMLRVAILSRSERERDCLREILETNSLHVVADDLFRESLVAGNDQAVADVILVNLDDSDDAELDTLLEQAELPMLFNDSASIRKQVTAGGRAWGRRLAAKLIEAAGERFSEEEIEESQGGYTATEAQADAGDSGTVEAMQAARPQQKAETAEAITRPAAVAYKDMKTAEIVAMNRDGSLDHVVNRAREIWVLGASIGGPQAIKQFLMHLPRELPVCFILAQHIGVGFVDLLAEQLSRITALKVTTPKEGMVLEKGHLVVAPVDQRINFSERGVISLEEIKQRSIYSPSIDDVMTVVAKHYGDDANAIIFSGMGNDGTAGCHLIAQKGGTIWAQEPNSCVISSMADSVRHAGIVSDSGTPDELALRLIEKIEGEVSS